LVVLTVVLLVVLTVALLVVLTVALMMHQQLDAQVGIDLVDTCSLVLVYRTMTVEGLASKKDDQGMVSGSDEMVDLMDVQKGGPRALL